MKKNTDPWAVEEHLPHRPSLFANEDLTLRIIQILDKGKELGGSIQQVCDCIAQHSTLVNAVSVRIRFNELVFQSLSFEESPIMV